MNGILTTLGVLTLASWFYLLNLHGRFWRCSERLDGPDDREPAHWPEVAAVIPARNEAATITEVLRSLLAQDYPGEFSILVVDDRSSDPTAELARRVGRDSASQNRLSVIEGEPLPAGWAGKLWALDQGCRHTIERQPNCRFLWLADADIAHAPTTLRALVRKAEAEQRDLVSLMAKLSCSTGCERLLIPAFVFFFQKLYPFARANDPRRRTAAAAGGCVLLRREALERIGGIAAIRNALIDDCALADAVKRSGGRTWIGLTELSQSLRVYADLKSIWSMVARSAFTQLRYSASLLVGTVLGMALLYLAPPLLFLIFPLHGNGVAAGLGGLAWLSMLLAYGPTMNYFGRPRIAALALPVTALLYTAMTIDSARRHWFGSGSHWKGRDYRRQGAAG